ncbi:hypothetical protein BC332_01898 [Capsicum chinense]|uniref:Uncharacterized protein n=1 Tax=Capsicum annuum TaxID=4072 RepID=A0A2G3AJ21_CAPAN|nr:hypothetical protein FXO38_14702 [Capsicum annuum]KAF3657586.1 hypothetical protein FXO37_14842 [Capsicum annuum]PHT94163.1 hypothetical protein T459_02045 [Capsicum annuum]PHU29805.1 hypothetical protein BC332_01898 [Capsicum chinense]
MAHKKDQLAKIGQEGFDLIDEFWGNRKERPSTPQRPYYASELRPNPPPSLYRYHPQIPHVVQLQPAEERVCNINSYDAFQMYQGEQYFSSKRKSPSTAAVAF